MHCTVAKGRNPGGMRISGGVDCVVYCAAGNAKL